MLNRGALVSLCVGLLVLGLKFAAYRVTGSVGLLSDALESLVNVAAAGVALWALFVAAKPADREHPFGHGKAEYFSATLEGALILFAAVQIVGSAWAKFSAPSPLEDFGLGALLSGAASALNLGLGMYLLRLARAQRSPALEADGHHILSDVWSSLGVLGGVALSHWLALPWLDPVVALAVAVYIVWVGYRLVRRSLSALLDESLERPELQRIQALLAYNLGPALQIHDLRARRAGPGVFVEFHLVVPSQMSVLEAHRITDALEALLEQDLPGSSTLIHLEPEDQVLEGEVVQHY